MSIASRKVLVLMSGGVDSAVAVALLKDHGCYVTGATMKIWDGARESCGGLHHGCFGPEEKADIEDANAVAQKLGIPFQVIDMTKEYRSKVLDYFCDEYLSGRTPNPCVRCNLTIKFGVLIEKARYIGLDFDYIASGHYARVAYDKNRHRCLLKKAKDSTKDQSYFLSFLSQKQLGQLILPLGDYTKSEVRKMAQRLGLQVADKPDSQNFIAGDYTSIFSNKPNSGLILDKAGKVLGQHQGIQFYTIGQRKGLGLATQEPLYVTALDPGRNAVIVGKKEDVYGNGLIISNLNWIAIEETNQALTLKVKIRSSHKEAKAVVTPIDYGNVRVKFIEPQFAITPGQAVVFYQEDVVIGGGIIERVNT